MFSKVGPPWSGENLCISLHFSGFFSFSFLFSSYFLLLVFCFIFFSFFISHFVLFSKYQFRDPFVHLPAASTWFRPTSPQGQYRCHSWLVFPLSFHSLFLLSFSFPFLFLGCFYCCLDSNAFPMVKTVSDFSVTFSLADHWMRFQRLRIIPRKLYSHLLHSVIIYHINIF